MRDRLADMEKWAATHALSPWNAMKLRVTRQRWSDAWLTILSHLKAGGKIEIADLEAQPWYFTRQLGLDEKEDVEAILRRLVKRKWIKKEEGNYVWSGRTDTNDAASDFTWSGNDDLGF